MKTTLLVILNFVLIVGLLSCHSKSKKENIQTHVITDMMGRKVTVPLDIKRVYCADMATTIFAYSIVPDLLIAKNSELTKKAKSLVSDQFYNLPILGNVFVGRSDINMEELLQLKPQVLLCPVFAHTKQKDVKAFEKAGELLGAAVVFVALDMDKLATSYHFIGKIVNRASKAKILADYCTKTIQRADSFKTKYQDSLSIYIAEGTNGLHTIPSGSTHSKVFEMVGLKNCATISDKYGYTDISINMEQVLNWEPNYIIINDRSVTNNAKSVNLNNTWKTLKAIKNNKILKVPNDPFNWIGRPPSINRLIGIQWLIYAFYTHNNTQFNDEIKSFYSLFYHVTLNNKTIETLLP